MLEAVGRAVEVYRTQAAWKRIQQQGMRQDHSWDVSAREYVKVYRASLGAASSRLSGVSPALTPVG
jgi:starch synthase